MNANANTQNEHDWPWVADIASMIDLLFGKKTFSVTIQWTCRSNKYRRRLSIVGVSVYTLKKLIN